MYQQLRRRVKLGASLATCHEVHLDMVRHLYEHLAVLYTIESSQKNGNFFVDFMGSVVCMNSLLFCDEKLFGATYIFFSATSGLLHRLDIVAKKMFLRHRRVILFINLPLYSPC